MAAGNNRGHIMDDSNSSLPAWLAFSLTFDTAAGHCQTLLRSHHDPAGIAALITQFREDRSDDVIAAFRDVLDAGQLQRLRDPHLLQKIQQALDWEKSDPLHHLIGLDHPRYPALLSTTDDAPPLLYAKGDLTALERPALAIVGSRKASRHAIDLTHTLARQVAARDVVIVSGLARGIDAAAHEGALAAGGRTIAVAATEPDSIYPKHHALLAKRIMQNGGLIMTEYPLGSPTLRWHFPKRNRIISGMSLGVLVAEAALPSGTLTTAAHALEQGREVMAIPGLVGNPMVRGCHALIRNGAVLVESEQDILDTLSSPLLRELVSGDSAISQGTLALEEPSLTEFEKRILAALAAAPATLDDLMTQADCSISQLSSRLGMMEIEGKIKACAGGRYSRCY